MLLAVVQAFSLAIRRDANPDFWNHKGEVEALDESVVADGNVITGQGLGASIPFALKVTEMLTDKATADKIASAICYRG